MPSWLAVSVRVNEYACSAYRAPPLSRGSPCTHIAARSLARSLSYSVTPCVRTGAFNNIVFKATGELAFSAESEHWSTVHPYYHIILILGLSLMQISHINQGLRHSNAVSFLPMYNCFYIVLTSSLGGLFFGEFDSMPLVSAILFPLGVMVTLFGIAGMTIGVDALERETAKVTSLTALDAPSPA